MKQFMPLREEAQKRGNMIKAAGDRHAGPDEACKLIKNFAQAEIKMMTYVEKNAAKCGIPPQVTDQLKNGRKNTELLQTRVATLPSSSAAQPAATMSGWCCPSAISRRITGAEPDDLNVTFCGCGGAPRCCQNPRVVNQVQES